MATRIIELKVKTVGGSWVGLPSTPFTPQAALTPTASTQQSAAFGADTNVVSIEADEDIHVDFGSAPTATLACPKVWAKTTREFLVTPGHKVAVRTGV